MIDLAISLLVGASSMMVGGIVGNKSDILYGQLYNRAKDLLNKDENKYLNHDIEIALINSFIFGFNICCDSCISKAKVEKQKDLKQELKKAKDLFKRNIELNTPEMKEMFGDISDISLLIDDIGHLEKADQIQKNLLYMVFGKEKVNLPIELLDEIKASLWNFMKRQFVEEIKTNNRVESFLNTKLNVEIKHILETEFEKVNNKLDNVDAKLIRLDEKIDKVFYTTTHISSIQSNIGEPKTTFKDRVEIVEDIYNTFSSGVNTIFLEGMGGIGKSEIAKKFAKNYKNDFDTIVFANFSTNLETLFISDKEIRISNFSRGTNSDGKQEKDVEYFDRKLAKLKEISDTRALLIIDNFDVDYDIHLEEVMNGKYKLLITTRNDFSDYGFNIIKIEEIKNMNIVKEMFFECYGSRDIDGKILTEILNMVNSHTMTVELIAKQMDAGLIDPEDMLQALRKTGISAFDEKIKHDVKMQARTAYDFVKALFDMSKLNMSERDIMLNMSVMPYSGVSRRMFKELCELKSMQEVNNLIDRSWIRHDVEIDFISLHPVVAEVVRKEFAPTIDNTKILFDHFTRKLKSIKGMNINEFYKYESLALSILQGSVTYKADDSEIVNRIREFIVQLGYFQVSIDTANNIVNLMENRYSTNSIQTAKALNTLGSTYFNIGDYNKSYETYSRCTDLFKNLKVEEGYSEGLLNKGLAALELNLLTTAIECMEEALEIKLKLFDENSTKVAVCRHSLSKAYLANRQYDRAKYESVKALEIFEIAFGPNNIDVSSPLWVMGKIELERKNIKEAIDFLNRALAIRIALNGEEHFLNMNLYELLIGALLKNGDKVIASNYLQIMKNIDQKFYSSKSEKIRKIEESFI